MKISLPSAILQMYCIFDTPQRLRFFLLLLLLLVQSLVEVLGLAMILPLLYVAQFPERIADNEYLGAIYHFFGFTSESGFTLFLATLLVSAFLFKGIFAIRVIKMQTDFSHGVAQSLIARQSRIGLHMDYLKFKERNSNHMVQDMVTIPIEFGSNIVLPVLMVLAEILVAMVVAVGVALYDHRVFLGLVCVLLPPIYFFHRLTRKRIVRLGKEKNRIRPEAYKYAFAAIHGIENVKTTHSQNYFVSRLSSVFRSFFEKMSRLVVLENVPVRIIEFIAVASISLIVVYSMYFREVARPLLPLLVIFATAAYRLMPSMNRILSNLIKIKGSSYVFDRIKDFANLEHETFKETGEARPVVFDKSITLRNIGFRYPGSASNVLNHIDLTIPKGEFLGIVGQSGQGKSTLLRLFLKLHEPSEGEILVDGVALTPPHNRAWQNMIGYVQQNVFLMDGSIEENVAFGRIGIDTERVEECLKAAALSDFVSTLKYGQKSPVGEFGSSMSGGQRQRLAIARALYRDAKILVLDEATSALDKATETEIMNTLKSLKSRGLTVLVVAHRITSLKGCDRIIEIQGGKIVREMTFADLVKTDK